MCGCRALNGSARRRHLWVRAVRKITNQRSAALLESLTAETKLIPAVPPGDSNAAPPDDVTTGTVGDGAPVANVSDPAGKPDDSTSCSQTGKRCVTQNVPFTLSLNTVAMWHRQPASAGSSGDSCGAQGGGEMDTLYDRRYSPYIGNTWCIRTEQR